MKRETIDLKLLHYFVVTYETLNITRAGETLKLPKSTISKGISKLEADLNLKLFDRSSRAIIATEAADLLYQRANSLLQDVSHLVTDLTTMKNSVTGKLHISAPPALGRFLSDTIISKYLKLYPDVSVSLTLSYQFEDLFKQGIDMAFRMGKNLDDTLIERPLGKANRVVVATPEYLAQHDSILQPQDLVNHRCLQLFDEPIQSWTLIKNGETQYMSLPVSFNCSDVAALKLALLQHVGIAQLPWLTVREEIEQGKLKHLLPGWVTPDIPISLVYRQGLNKPAKVRAFLELLEENLELFQLKWSQ